MAGLRNRPDLAEASSEGGFGRVLSWRSALRPGPNRALTFGLAEFARPLKEFVHGILVPDRSGGN